jgi:mono/diheme cytochrome c family protein
LVKYVRSLNPKNSATTTTTAVAVVPNPAIKEASSGSTPKTLSQDEARGKHLFLQNCSLCHLSTYSKLPDWKEATNTPRPVGPSLAGELEGADTDREKAVRTLILNGTVHMPGFKYALKTKQIDDLIAYLKTQKKGEGN